LSLVLHIKFCLIPIGAELDPGQPGRGSAHLFADDLVIDVLAALNDQFIMYVSADEAVGEGSHGVAEDVPADRLDDVLDELRAVGFDSLPFLRRSDAHVGDGFSAEAVLSDPRLHIGQHPAGGELDEEHSTLAEEMDAADLCRDLFLDCRFDGSVDVPPEGGDHRIGRPPGVDQRLQLFFLEPHLQGTHRFQSADGAAVAEGKLCNLTLLPEMSIDPVLHDRDTEHLAGGGTVDVLPLSEDL